MARASKIWIINAPHGPAHAFTVKHELVSFLRRYPEQQKRTITSLSDGTAASPVVTVPGEIFMAANG